MTPKSLFVGINESFLEKLLQIIFVKKAGDIMFLSKVGKIYYIYFINPNTGKRTKISTKERTKVNALRYLYKFGNKQRPKHVNKLLIEFKVEFLHYAQIEVTSIL